MIEQLKNQLIVSCQALPDEPLHGSSIMARMAIAAKEGGAAGIRANGVEDIQAIQAAVDLPIIGIIKAEYEGASVYITPTIKEIDALVSLNVDLIALDATNRNRPDGSTISTLFPLIKTRYPNQRFMADCATLDDAVRAEQLGFDVVAPTLYGYTAETIGKKVYESDFQFLREMVQIVSIPVIAEGNVMTPEHARRVLELGAYAVVVGGAITRPQQIAKRFVEKIHTSPIK